MPQIDAQRWAGMRGAMLLAGDAHSLSEMLDIASVLPADVHTTILIEVFTSVQVRELNVRDGVRVTWLVRAGADGDSYARGHRLAAAVEAWCAEWSCVVDGLAPECTVWLAARTPPRVVRMARALIEHDGAEPPD
jgi:NADPH-dependent ferric siderophore reductase